MTRTFLSCYKFNQPLDRWDVSNVMSMECMFENCNQFNQPLNTWDTQNVVDMSHMFERCFRFNQQLNRWNVENVIYMGSMFRYCYAFNQPLDMWKCLSIINICDMFAHAVTFNSSLPQFECGDELVDYYYFSTKVGTHVGVNSSTKYRNVQVYDMLQDCRSFDQPVSRIFAEICMKCNPKNSTSAIYGDISESYWHWPMRVSAIYWSNPYMKQNAHKLASKIRDELRNIAMRPDRLVNWYLPYDEVRQLETTWGKV